MIDRQPGRRDLSARNGIQVIEPIHRLRIQFDDFHVTHLLCLTLPS